MDCFFFAIVVINPGLTTSLKVIKEFLPFLVVLLKERYA
jgi:hypothetical protein